MTGLMGSPTATITTRRRYGGQPPNPEESCQWFTFKLVGMMFLITFDLALNSSLEYDQFANQADLTLIMFGYVYADWLEPPLLIIDLLLSLSCL